MDLGSSKTTLTSGVGQGHRDALCLMSHCSRVQGVTTQGTSSQEVLIPNGRALNLASLWLTVVEEMNLWGSVNGVLPLSASQTAASSCSQSILHFPSLF